MKAKNGQVDEELMAIKQFRNNHARDLMMYHSLKGLQNFLKQFY